MITPPGISSSDFSSALSQFANVVGASWVYSDDADLELYRDAYSPIRGEPDERVASAAIAPQSVAEVQAIVRIANRFQVPLYAISTGRNLTYGGSAPVYSGCVVLDLKRMNRIIEVNEAGAYCVVEPGVSFFDLYQYIRENKLKVRMEPPDPGWGSPLGNALEHGVGRQVYRDHFRAQCGLEVVTATGDLLRTGMGAVPNSGLWPRFRYGYGPYIDGIFASSNFGIVTKMGFHMLPEPEMTRMFDVSIAGFDDVDDLIDEISRLHDSGVLNCNSELTAPLLSTSIPESKSLLESAGGGSSQQWDALGERLGMPPWALMNCNCMGPTKIVDAHYDFVIDRLSRFRGFKVNSQRNYPQGIDPQQVPLWDRCAMGIPSLVVFTGTAMSRGHGHMDFSPIFPMTGDALRKINALLKQGYRDVGVSWPGWAGGNTWFDKTFTMIRGFELSSDPADNRKMVTAFRHLVQLLGANGFAEYRTHAIFQDLLMAQYSYNNHALLRFNEAIKDAVDPRGILSPGRAGIWPDRLRKRGGSPT
jgi:FAD/FMN-containing dehydrogenase